MRFFPCFAAFLFVLLLPLFARAGDLPRIAVVADSPEPSLASFADLLTVSLANASNQYTLVERGEIAKLASEAEIQKLSAVQQPAALAQLANADALLIAALDNGDPRLPRLHLRLTASRSGLVLNSLILGGKTDDFPKAAELAAGVLRFPCERLTRSDDKSPTVISLLGIRPAFEIDRALETSLNLAVAQQLSSQPGVTVSERWRMNDLVFERSLAEEKPPAFATGNLLLDGSYTRKGDVFEITLRLRKSETGPGETHSLTATSPKPAALAREIARFVISKTTAPGEATTWDTLAEARQYAELSRWLMKRNLNKEAAQTLESAVALGCDEGRPFLSRAWAYQKDIEQKLDHAPARPEVNGLDEIPKPEFRRKFMAAIRMSQCLMETLEARWPGVSLQDYSNDNRLDMVKAHLETNFKILFALHLRGEHLDFATEARALRTLCSFAGN
ncbi:MAG: hypothetical protein QM680_01575 [Luteolibacter sp.]